jgi:hypothetical protein
MRYGLRYCCYTCRMRCILRYRLRRRSMMPLLLRSVDRHQYGCRVLGTCARSRECSLTVPTLGMASKGRLSKAPILEMSSDVLVCDGSGCSLAGGTSSYHLQAQSPPPVGV